MKKDIFKNVLEDVPNDQVGVVVQDFVEDDAQKIELVKKSHGNWDITAIRNGSLDPSLDH